MHKTSNLSDGKKMFMLNVWASWACDVGMNRVIGGLEIVP